LTCNGHTQLRRMRASCSSQRTLLRPKASKASPASSTGEQMAVNQFSGTVLSQSFAATEQSFHSAADVQVAQFDQVYQEARTNRVTVLGSSGDSGTANVDKQGRVFPSRRSTGPRQTH